MAIKRLLLCLSVAFLVGCTDAEIGQITALGSRFKITLYASGGQVIREWVSTGKVSTEGQSDGWYFTDSKTKKLVRVSGTVVVEELSDK